MLPTCVAEVVCSDRDVSEYMVRFFLEKIQKEKKRKKEKNLKKKVKFKNRQMRKLQGV